jgi:hypothetical protein
MIVRVDGEYSHIECDAVGCGRKSPPASVLIEKHGLAACGWHVFPGRHMCPDHFTDPAPAQGPQERTCEEQDKLDAERDNG